MHLVGLERGIVVVLRDKRNIPVPIDEAEIAIDANALDARNLSHERLEPLGNAVGVVAALSVVDGGELKEHNVANHALTIEISGDHQQASDRTQYP